VRIRRSVLVPLAALGAAALLLGSVTLLAGCGSKDKKSANAKIEGGGGSPGAKVFTDACGGCHTLAAAGTNGKVGPNLDELRPNEETVARQVRSGGNGMPSFSGKLSAAEIKLVSGFVSTSAGIGSAGKVTFKPDDTKIEDCKGNGSCYEQAFGNLAYDEGPKAALDKLAELEVNDPTIAGACHPIAHKIGAGGLLHYKGDVGKAFVAGNGTCGSGYYHGLLQWKLAGVSSDQVASVARTVCTNPEIRANAFNY
jgi:mono/diheme cytochrome c family protein